MPAAGRAISLKHQQSNAHKSISSKAILANDWEQQLCQATVIDFVCLLSCGFSSEGCPSSNSIAVFDAGRVLPRTTAGKGPSVGVRGAVPMGATSSLTPGGTQTSLKGDFRAICLGSERLFARIRQAVAVQAAPATLRSAFLEPISHRLAGDLSLELFARRDDDVMSMFAGEPMTVHLVFHCNAASDSTSLQGHRQLLVCWDVAETPLSASGFACVQAHPDVSAAWRSRRPASKCCSDHWPPI